MSKANDLTGRQYGRLTVQARAGSDRKGGALWQCLCACGAVTVANATNLRNGHTQSCGCFKRERSAEAHRTHGLYYTRLHRIWGAMLRRCYSPKSEAYKNYGGRGIAVCESWRRGFLAFYSWAMAHGYSDDLTLDRVDNDQGYSPENCRWVDWVTQANNRRNSKRPQKEGVKSIAD